MKNIAVPWYKNKILKMKEYENSKIELNLIL